MITGVSFDGLHCQKDLGMLLAQKEIGLPETQTNYIEVPGRNGSIDFTEALSGKIAYRDRIITLTFVTCKNVSKEEWPVFLSNVLNSIHGRKMKIIFDDDPDNYYYGRCEVSEFQTSWGKQTVVVECTCEPYKYDVADPSVKSL